MAYQVLYRAYRPATFADVVGQDAIVKTLKNAIKTQKIAHAYLFCGPRGTGKTSLAKLFAKAVNCDHFEEEPCDQCENCLAFNDNTHPDIIELDAASNNGVDDIRDIIEKARFAPVLGKYKVYIIDEVHMLSKQAFNALLKTLEEPPAHVIFILATTDPDKIIPTVMSRVQRYNFSKIATFDMTKRIKAILEKEKIIYEDEAINTIIKLADGGLRDALSILEQALAYDDHLTFDNLRTIYGLATLQEKEELLNIIHDHQINEALNILETYDQRGIDLRRLCLDLIDILKETILYYSRQEEGEASLSVIDNATAQAILQKADVDTLLEDIDLLTDVITKGKSSQDLRFYLELALLKRLPKAKAPAKEVIQEKPVMIQEESVEETISLPEKKTINYTMDELLSILKFASKEEKGHDAVVFNRLGLYELEVPYRKYYQALHNAELFASHPDIMIVCGEDPKLFQINDEDFNRELSLFIEKEFGISKALYAINQKTRDALINNYRQAKKDGTFEKIEPLKIQKKPNENTSVIPQDDDEEKLKALFGDKLKVEE